LFCEMSGNDHGESIHRRTAGSFRRADCSRFGAAPRVHRRYCQRRGGSIRRWREFGAMSDHASQSGRSIVKKRPDAPAYFSVASRRLVSVHLLACPPR
jgi:hypothetical protein